MSRCPKCEKAARAERRAAKAQGETGKPDRNGRMVHFSEEERKRRSELAKRLHAEGRLGGPVIGSTGGRAINSRRIADAVIEHFRQPVQQELAIKALEGALKGKNKHLRLAAARELFRTEEKVEDRMRADRGGAMDPSGMTLEELEAFVVQGVQSLIESGELPPDVVIDANDVTEVD